MTFYVENVLWTTLSLFGLMVGVVSALEARADLSALRILNKNGQRKIIAKTAFRTEILRIAVQLLFLTLGITTFSSPMPQNPHSLGSWTLIVAAAVIVANSVQGYIARREVITMAESDDRKRNALRDEGRDEGRDPIRDAARDKAHDEEESE